MVRVCRAPRNRMEVFLPPNFSDVRRVIDLIFPRVPKTYLTIDDSGAPAIFQFPGANDDTFTRLFTSLAAFRAMSSLFYMVCLHVYVRDRVKDVRFIMDRLVSGYKMISSVHPYLIFAAIVSPQYGGRYEIEPMGNIIVSRRGCGLVSMHFRL